MSELLKLPDEILVMILHYCSTSDLLQISRVCHKLNNITCDRKVVRVTNLHYHTNFQKDLVKEFLTFRPRAENITSIDLTSCYWLTSSFIRSVVSRLRNLENVLVADTALIPNHLKHILQTLSKIKRLSWTWRKGMDAQGLEEALQRLEFLYLCISESKNLNAVVKWVNKCVELRELWINNIDAYGYMRSDKPIQLEHLEKIVLHPCPFWPVVTAQSKLKQIWRSVPSILKLDKEQMLNIESIFTSKWRELSHVVELGSTTIERVCCEEAFGPNVDKVLSMLPRLKALNIVLPLHESRVPHEFFSDNLLAHNTDIKELSLDVCSKKLQECSTYFCEAASTCNKLSHLSLPVQALVRTDIVVNPYSAPASSSRKRVSRVKEDLSHDVETPFTKMVNCTPLVEVFEIGLTSESHFVPKMPSHLQWDWTSLASISDWKKLTSLTLANLPIKNGKFLTPILQDCKQLKSLKIVDLGHEAVCVYSQDLYNSLPFCTSLEDFHWTQNYVLSTTKLWLALQQISTLKRIALCLQGISSINETDVYNTMENCSSLFFLHIATCTPKVKNKLIKQTLLSRWTSIRPHLCVWFGTPGEFADAAETCPIVHAGEMLQDFSRIKGAPASGLRFLSFGRRAWAPQN